MIRNELSELNEFCFNSNITMVSIDNDNEFFFADNSNDFYMFVKKNVVNNMCKKLKKINPKGIKELVEYASQ